MKRIITFILAIAIVFNLVGINKNNFVHAIEPNVIWLEKEYDRIDEFNEGLARVNLDDKYGYIDKTGKEIIPLKYDDVTRDMGSNLTGIFSEGLAVVKINGRYGYIDKQGKEVIPFKYEWAGDFSEGLARVVLNNKCGYIDRKGKEVIPLKYNWGGDFNEGLARVVLSEKYSYIDKQGKEVISLKYRWLGDFSEGLAAVVLEQDDDYSTMGYIDKEGTPIIEFGRNEYWEIWDFSEGLARVGKWKYNDFYMLCGYIDKNGEFVIPPIYLDNNIDIGGVFVEEEGGFEWYDESESWRRRGDSKLKDGVIGVFREMRTTDSYDWITEYLDKQGKVLTTESGGALWGFSEGLIRHYVRGEGEGYLDKSGNIVIPYIYDDAGTFSDGVAVVKLNNKWGIIENPLIKKDIKVYGTPKTVNILKDVKRFIHINTEPKNVQFTYISKNPDIIKALDNGEIIGLKAGIGEIEVIATKKGYEDISTIIPIEVKEPLRLDFTWIKGSNKVDDITGKLEKILTDADKFYLEDSFILKEIVNYIDTSIEKISNSTIKGKNNKVTMNSNIIKNQILNTSDLKDKFQSILKSNKVNLDRDINSILNITLSKIDFKKPVLIELSNDLRDNINKVDGIRMIADEIKLSLASSSLIKELEKSQDLFIQIDKKDEVIKINFLDKSGKLISKLDNNITVELPIISEMPETSSVFYTNGVIDEQIGGQFNPSGNTISFETSQSGEYFIAESQKEYKDINHLSEEEKKAIAYMTSKGFINDKGEGIFDPDTEITRAEFTAFLVKVFYVLDRNLDVSFDDVSIDDWYYDYVASSEKEEIIKGFPDNTFRADEIIDREQIVSVCARALHEKKKYLYPENFEEYLQFIDSDEIGNWAKKEVALAYRETLIDMPIDRYFQPQESMTRADATVIVYRLFQLLYENVDNDIIRIPQASSNNIPIVPILGGGGLVVLGVAGGYIFRRRKIGGRNNI